MEAVKLKFIYIFHTINTYVLNVNTFCEQSVLLLFRKKHYVNAIFQFAMSAAS